MRRWRVSKKSSERLKEHLDILYFSPNSEFGEGYDFKSREEALKIWIETTENGDGVN